MLTNQERVTVARQFLDTVTVSPDRVLEISDYIQEAGKYRQALISLCKFGRSMQVRRLRSVSSRHWNNSDFSNAQSILEEITHLLKQQAKPENALALAVLGVEVEELDNALALLTASPSANSGDPPVANPGPPEPRSGEDTPHVDKPNKSEKAPVVSASGRSSRGRGN